jgi:Aldo/keto reductase family
MTSGLTRREFALTGSAAMLAPPAHAQEQTLLTRAIPGTGERLPAVGLGTAYVFDTNDEATKQKAAAVLQALIAGGGRLVDTASVYGDAEIVLGEEMVPAGLRQKLFIATKLEAPDAVELKPTAPDGLPTHDYGSSRTTAPASHVSMAGRGGGRRPCRLWTAHHGGRSAVGSTDRPGVPWH